MQGLCDASPEQAGTIIVAAGMQVGKRRSGGKPMLAAKQGVAGEAVLEANRRQLTGGSSKQAVFNWQWSVDGGKSWVSAPPTSVASTRIQGLPSVTTASFRVSATIARSQGDWSQVVTLVVH